SQNITKGFQKLNKNIGDLRAGQGQLNTMLKATNPALLNQLKNVGDSDEAFKLMLETIRKTPDEFDRASLAQAAFGRAGQDIIQMAEIGSEGIGKLREEARKYGVISNQSAEQAEKFKDAQANLNQVVQGLKNQLGSALLPVITSVMDKFRDFLMDTEGLKKKLDILLPILGGVAAGLAACVVISKVVAAIKGFSTAMLTLNAVMAANPIGAIAAAIGVLIAAGIAVWRNWDKISAFLAGMLEKIKARFIVVGAKIKEVWTLAFNGVKIAVISLGQTILDKLLGTVQKVFDKLSGIKFIGKYFKGASDSIGGLREGLEAAKNAAVAQSNTAIAEAKKQTAAAITERNRRLDAFAQESEEVQKLAKKSGEEAESELAKRIENLNKLKSKITVNPGTEDSEDAPKKTKPPQLGDLLTEELQKAAQSERAIYQSRLSDTQNFLQKRMQQEGIGTKGRIAFLKAEGERIKAIAKKNGMDTVAIEEAIQNEILKAKQKAAQEAIAIAQSVAGGVMGVMSGLSQLGGRPKER
ncbi:MAG: hypothetical protein AAF975_07150, partial [Spirochaetota bacterium]